MFYTKRDSDQTLFQTQPQYVWTLDTTTETTLTSGVFGASVVFLPLESR